MVFCQRSLRKSVMLTGLSSSSSVTSSVPSGPAGTRRADPGDVEVGVVAAGHQAVGRRRSVARRARVRCTDSSRGSGPHCPEAVAVDPDAAVLRFRQHGRQIVGNLHGILEKGPCPHRAQIPPGASSPGSRILGPVGAAQRRGFRVVLGELAPVVLAIVRESRARVAVVGPDQARFECPPADREVDDVVVQRVGLGGAAGGGCEQQDQVSSHASGSEPTQCDAEHFQCPAAATKRHVAPGSLQSSSSVQSSALE